MEFYCLGNFRDINETCKQRKVRETKEKRVTSVEMQLLKTQKTRRRLEQDKAEGTKVD